MKPSKGGVGGHQSEQRATQAEPHTAEDVEAALRALDDKDKVGRAGEAIATAGGLAAGVTAAGAIAGAAGATTFFGSSALGGLVGGVLVTVTPIGWVVGCAVAGGTAAYGISRMIRSGGRQDEVRKGIKERLSKRLAGLRSTGSGGSGHEQLRVALSTAMDQQVLDESQATRMLLLVERGTLPVETALQRVRALVAESTL